MSSSTDSSSTAAPTKPTKTFRLTVTIVANADNVEELVEAATKQIHVLLPGSKISAEATTDTTDRYLVMDGQFGREPLHVSRREDLRALKAPSGEVAAVANANPNAPPSAFIYQSGISPTSPGLDLALITSSSHGGCWIDVGYFQFLMAQQQQAQQQQAQQRAQQQRAGGGNGMPPRNIR